MPLKGSSSNQQFIGGGGSGNSTRTLHGGNTTILRVAAPTIVQFNLSGEALPGGVFINYPAKVTWIRFVPGIASFNAVNQNGNLGVRFYKVFSDTMADSMYHPTPSQVIQQRPDWLSTMFETTDIPWDADLRLFIEFVLPGTNTAPANSTIEFCMTPYAEG